MRLCIVASGDFYSNYGGGQVYVHNIVDEFIRQQEQLHLELTLISFSSNFNTTATRKNYHGISLFEISPNGAIADLLRQIAPDVVHTNGEKALMAHLCKELNIPCIVTAHHGGLVCPAGTLLNCHDNICLEAAYYTKCLPCYLRNIRSGEHWYPWVKHLSHKRYLRIGRRLQKLPFFPFITPIGEAAVSIEDKISTWNRLKEDTTLFIAPSQAMADALMRNGADKSKVVVSPHGVSIPESCSNVPSPKNIATQFYYVGRICHVKGIHILLEAFDRLGNIPAELHLIGGAGNKGEQRYMSRLQKKYHDNCRIIWHGKVAAEEVSNITKDFDCLIHPAIYVEVFGLNIAEALAQGKHVISTRCGGAEMQIEESDKPWLIEPNNIDALQQAMLWYVQQGRVVEEKYHLISIEEHIHNLYHIYTSCIQPK
jgi:glycosyltransferase involved in cell wall biosynthesis